MSGNRCPGQAHGPPPSPRRPRVVHLIKDLRTGGAETLVGTMARYWSGQSFEYELWCLHEAPNSGTNGAPSGDQKHREQVAAYGVPVRCCARPGPSGVARGFVQLLRRVRPDVLHSHLPVADFYARLLGRLCGVKCIMSSVHGLPERYLSTGSLGNRLLKRIVLHPRWGALTVCGQASAQQLTGYYPNARIHVIPNGIELQQHRRLTKAELRVKREAVGVPEEGALILAVGRISSPKGHVDLVRAVPAIVAEVPSAFVVIAGEGEEMDTLRAAAASLGDLAVHVRVIGYWDDLAGLMAAADIYVLPSRWDAMPLSVLEAMSWGLPIVATNVGCVPEMLGHGSAGLLVPPQDSEALAKEILRLLRNPSLASALGKAALVRVQQHYDIRRTVAAFQDLYADLLAGRASGQSSAVSRQSTHS